MCIHFAWFLPFLFLFRFVIAIFCGRWPARNLRTHNHSLIFARFRLVLSTEPSFSGQSKWSTLCAITCGTNFVKMIARFERPQIRTILKNAIFAFCARSVPRFLEKLHEIADAWWFELCSHGGAQSTLQCKYSIRQELRYEKKGGTVWCVQVLRSSLSKAR